MTEKTENDFKLVCLQTGRAEYFTQIEIDRLIKVTARYQRNIYRKLKPFNEFQKKYANESHSDSLLS